MSQTPYSRILLKLSGEQLSGKYEFGVDPEIARFLADEIRIVLETTGTQIVLIVGGGNMVRGAEIAGNGIRRVTADQMGMLSGLINSMALTDIFESRDVPTRCLSNIYATQLAESYSYRLAEKHLQNNRVVIVAGGIARPYVTHDTAAASIGLELDCQLVMKATKVDGVYSKDPTKYPDAIKIDHLNYDQAVRDSDITVMDTAALGLAMEHKLPILIFDAMKPGSILAAVQKEPIGTMISEPSISN